MTKTKMKQHIPVFVCSTYEDLIPYRQAVQNTLIRLETIIKGMEFFGSKPDSPKKECLKIVSESKIFICIVAMKYGSIDKESGKSMVQLEYEEAQKLNLPTLIYLIDEENQPIIAKFVDTGKSAQKLRIFKNQLLEKHLVSFFTTPEDLASKLSHDLPDILSEIGLDVKELSREILADKENAMRILKTFRFRPRKVAFQEVALDIKIDKNTQFYSVTPTDALAYNIPAGDCFRIYTDCYLDDVNLGSFNVYAYGESGDWIEENFQKVAKISAIVSLRSATRYTYYKIKGTNYADKVEENLQGLVVKKILLNE